MGVRNRAPADDGRLWRRRSVVEWLGKATVLALGSELLHACSSAAEPPGASGAPRCDEPVDFPFEPGPTELGVLADWPERTVDPQDLAALLASWRLAVDGLVATPLELTFVDLLALPRQDQVTDLHCVQGWSVHDVPWNGVPCGAVLDLAGPLPAATHVTLHCARAFFNASLPLEVLREPRSLLAYGVGCHTIPLEHGFPLRAVVPRKFGYKNAKYLVRLELTDHPVDGYWVKWGYPYDADVPEHRLRPGKY